MMAFFPMDVYLSKKPSRSEALNSALASSLRATAAGLPLVASHQTRTFLGGAIFDWLVVAAAEMDTFLPGSA
jgi:hypothetical protein